MPEILFAAESAESRSLPLNAQRLVNFFTEKQQPGAKSQTPLFAAPGMSSFSNLASTVGGIANFGTITGGSNYIPSSSGIATLGALVAGSGYVAGTYSAVALTGGSGSGAKATIIVNSTGNVATVLITVQGTGYKVGDSISAAAASLGGTGSGFAVPVATVNLYNNIPLIGGHGTGAQANISVNGAGAVSSVVLTDPGINYLVGDVLSSTAPILGSKGGVHTVGSLVGGSNYAAGTYTNVPFTGGSGSGAQGTITVNGSGVVSAAAPTVPGSGYNNGDTLSTIPSNLGSLSGIVTLGSITGGTGYITGTYTGVPLFGGSGVGATANITVNGSGVVSAVTTVAVGTGFTVGDVLSAAATSIGGAGGVKTLGSITGGSGYPTGVYPGVPLTGGSGSGVQATVTVNGSGIVSAVATTTPGINYVNGDVLSIPVGSGASVVLAWYPYIGSIYSGSVQKLVGGSNYYTNNVVASWVVPSDGSYWYNGNIPTIYVTVVAGVITGITFSILPEFFSAYGVYPTISFSIPGSGFSVPVVTISAGSGFSVPVASVQSGSGFSVSIISIYNGVGFSVPVNSISTSGPARGSWVKQDVPYVVSGSTLYQINSDGTNTIVGSGISGSDIVGMADNGHQLCIVSGQAQQGWILDTNSASTTYGFQNITAAWTAAGFGPANTVSFFDGYFVFDMVGTNEFFLSSLYDGTAYNGLDFASAESQPDFVTGTVQNLQLLFVICQDHLELWYDAGASNFPFQRYTGAGISYGCVSPHTIIKQDGAIFFLGTDKIFYRLQSTVPIRVSTHAMEHIIAQETNITASYCFTYTLEGHKFVVLQLPASKRTLVFDISTQRWHERESWDANNASLGMWRASTAFRAFNNTYLGDAFNATVNLLDWTVYTENGNTIRGLAYSIPYHQDRKRLFVSRFELDIQAGVGTSSGAGSDPQIMLTWSVDGANTFMPLQFWRSMGKIGQYLQRLRWLRMGNGRQFVFQISCTDPVPRVIISAHADISIGM